MICCQFTANTLLRVSAGGGGGGGVDMRWGGRRGGDMFDSDLTLFHRVRGGSTCSIGLWISGDGWMRLFHHNI